ncbi:membrane protein [Burkholderia glumae]|uniref:Glycine zipper family protein n=1 Tax=Burkholderia glumae TaxID=337 RepID=A0AAQ0BUV7_BURGL|nr:membrane protein [Burkholderia glumae]ACR28951.1 Hypothetical protein bglu_1g18270 [Burkholderia glumae BGR1]AJY65004.1 hypothetical protein KS03_2680 [Burkholderia glumae LMG 2196 = ATCC 33617]KHJ61000.1 membrane protein [Burkholderia glumae]MCM2483208.1 hypothetical protein [Burkholderia glumae]MCM2506525.1 hypothetical protein [Burkholderia glumae]
MTMIVTGNFQTFADAEASRRRLMDQRFRRDDVSIFFLNPHGQHGRFPIGGDVYADTAAKPGGRGAIAGTVRGVSIGLLLGLLVYAIGHTPWWVPVATTLLGAYLGAFSGALARMRGRAEEGTGALSGTEHGVVLAAHVTESNATTAEEILRSTGAMSVERVDGEWRDGRWQDFDPTRRPDDRA